MIREATVDDSLAISEIYNYYVLHTIITFEEKEVSSEEFKHRIFNITSKYPWLVFEENKQVLGYAFASQWKVRSAYDRTVEGGIYIDHNSYGKGIGSLLYQELLTVLKEKQFHAVLGGIALPNERSIALHEKLGFQKVAELKQVGLKFGKWIDVGYWEKLLND